MPCENWDRSIVAVIWVSWRVSPKTFPLPTQLHRPALVKPAKLNHLGGQGVLQIDPNIFNCYDHDVGDFFKQLTLQYSFDLDASALPHQSVQKHLRHVVHSATHKVFALIGRSKQNLGEEPGSADLGVVGNCDGCGDRGRFATVTVQMGMGNPCQGLYGGTGSRHYGREAGLFH